MLGFCRSLGRGLEEKRIRENSSVADCFLPGCVCRPPLWADAGWAAPDTRSGGSVYSEKENQYIALEEEAIIAIPDGDYMLFTAHFRFRNTSNRSIEASVGFPVVNRIFAPFGLESGGPELILQGVILDRLMNPSDREQGPVLEMLSGIDGKPRELSWEKFIEEVGAQREILRIADDSQNGYAVSFP